MRRWIGGRLHAWADRIDSHGSTRLMGYSFTFETGEGIRFRNDGRGCPLAYLGQDDYDRAHSESDSK